jgi:phosphohistidine phosphatase
LDETAPVHGLHLLRHAKSSWDEPGLPDHERPLAPRGRKAAKKLARYLRDEETRPDLILCSSAQRTRETLARIRSSLGEPAVEIEDRLYGAGPDTLLGRLREVPEAVVSVLLIGHNPGLQELALRLAPPDPQFAEKFPTGALASFVIAEPWARLGEVQAELRAYVVPRELR